jgi:hypothetical protein
LTTALPIATPRLCFWICDAIGTLQTPYLDEYASSKDSREEVLKKTGKDKTSFLVMLNKDYNNPKGQC